MLDIHIRLMNQADVEASGRLCYTAFKHIADCHHFRPDFPSSDIAIQLTEFLYANPQVFSIVADGNDGIVGANHLWEYDEIRAVGRITVTPSVQSNAWAVG